MDILDSASLHLTSAMTLAAWVNPASVSTAWQDVIYKGNVNYFLMASSSNGGSPVGGGTFGTTIKGTVGPAALAANTWTYLATTYDGSTIKLYVNGVQVSSVAMTGTIKTSLSPLQIGGDTISGQNFKGLIDEVRVYSRSLTQAEIQSDMAAAGDLTDPTLSGVSTSNLTAHGVTVAWTSDEAADTQVDYGTSTSYGSTSTLNGTLATGHSVNLIGLAANTTYHYRVRSRDAVGNLAVSSDFTFTTTVGAVGLVAEYTFNEGAGSTVLDTSGNSNLGTIVGATWTTAGKYGNALSFNGTSNRVDILDSSSLHLTSAMTLAAWVNPTSLSSAWQDVIYKGNVNYFLMASSDNGGSPVGGGTFGSTIKGSFGTAALAANTWTYLATTYDGSFIKLYVNGVQVSSVAMTGPIKTSLNPLQIGGDTVNGQNFKGLIDEVRVYNRSLTQAEIQSDMAANLVAASLPTSNVTPSQSLLYLCRGPTHPGRSPGSLAFSRRGHIRHSRCRYSH